MHSDFQTGQIYTKGSGHLKCQFSCRVLSLGSQKHLISQTGQIYTKRSGHLDCQFVSSFKFGGTKLVTFLRMNINIYEVIFVCDIIKVNKSQKQISLFSYPSKKKVSSRYTNSNTLLLLIHLGQLISKCPFVSSSLPKTNEII